MRNSLSEIYKVHHARMRRSGFSLLEKERGQLLSLLIGKGQKVLDLGCRDGTLTQYFAEGNEIMGVDIDESLLAQAQANLGIHARTIDLNGDWAELKEQSFDVVVAGEILEHLYFPSKVIQKAANLLNSEGMFVGSVPNAFSIKNRIRYLLGKKKNTPLEDPTHINHFMVKELKKLLRRHFAYVEIRGLGKYAFLARVMPSWFAFDLFFIGRKKYDR